MARKGNGQFIPDRQALIDKKLEQLEKDIAKPWWEPWEPCEGTPWFWQEEDPAEGGSVGYRYIEPISMTEVSVMAMDPPGGKGYEITRTQLQLTDPDPVLKAAIDYLVDEQVANDFLAWEIEIAGKPREEQEQAVFELMMQPEKVRDKFLTRMAYIIMAAHDENQVSREEIYIADREVPGDFFPHKTWEVVDNVNEEVNEILTAWGVPEC